MYKIDSVVVGAGLIGLAVAREMALRGLDVLVLEKEATVGTGVSSRNSEVVHAGIYYPEKSLKARLSREGRDLLYTYALDHGVPHRQCGKLIVANGRDQLEELSRVAARARGNDVHDLRSIDKAELREMEPAVQAEAALLSPSTGVIDTHALMLALHGDIENAGGMVLCRAPVTDAAITSDGIQIEVAGDEPSVLIAGSLINCAGLEAQAVARAIRGLDTATIPTRHTSIGHYYTLSGKSPFNRLIYPATAQDGGLAIHVTVDLAGQARFGPDARWIDKVDYQFDDSRRENFVTAIRSYYPDLDETRLGPGYTGIRPKLSGPGEPVADFQIQGPDQHHVPNLVNLYGIESPGLTASLAIARCAADAAIHGRYGC